MKIFLNSTANLGDFLNGVPVVSGIKQSLGLEQLTLIVKKEMIKFKGLKEFLLYQKNICDEVYFDDEIFMYGDIKILSSWYREDKNNPNRPTETCRYENFFKDNYKHEFEVNDKLEFKFPDIGEPVSNNYLVGDRWNVGDIDDRRETNILAHLDKFEFVDYDRTILENCYFIKNSPKPFITNFTGVGMLADLLNKDCLVVWKAEDWKPEYRVGEDVSWDNGKNIEQVFEKHFYLDRKAKLVHAKDLENHL
jgi:hypothetical protein